MLNLKIPFAATKGQDWDLKFRTLWWLLTFLTQLVLSSLSMLKLKMIIFFYIYHKKHNVSEKEKVFPRSSLCSIKEQKRGKAMIGKPTFFYHLRLQKFFGWVALPFLVSYLFFVPPWWHFLIQVFFSISFSLLLYPHKNRFSFSILLLLHKKKHIFFIQIFIFHILFLHHKKYNSQIFNLDFPLSTWDEHSCTLVLFHFHFSKKSEGILFFTFHFSKSGGRYQIWFNSIFEFCQKMIHSIFDSILLYPRFNSKYYSIQNKLWWFNSKYYSIQ